MQSQPIVPSEFSLDLGPIVAILRRVVSHNAAISGQYRVEPERDYARPRVLEQATGEGEARS
jgi:hypothetical protein